MRLGTAILLVKVRDSCLQIEEMSNEEKSNWLDIPNVMLNISVKRFMKENVFCKIKKKSKRERFKLQHSLSISIR